VKNFPSKIKRNNEAHEFSIDFSSHITEMDSLVLQGLHDFLPDTSKHGHPTNIPTSKENKSLDAAKAMWNDKLPPNKTSIILSNCAQH
jgi:hypothetical protein